MTLRTAYARRRGLGPARAAALLVAAALLAPPATAAAATTAKSLYTHALARERALQDARTKASLADIRALVRLYERIPYRFPVSGYSDNALWQGAGLALVAYGRFHDEADRRTGERLLNWLRKEYPASSLVRRVSARLTDFDQVAKSYAQAQAAARAAAARAAQEAKAADDASRPASGPATIRQITRQPLSTGSRVVIQLDGEVPYDEQELDNPPRVFFDLKGAQVGPGVDENALAAPGNLIRQIRLGQHPDDTTRVVMELADPSHYSVFALFDPYRLVIDFDRPGARTAAPAEPPVTPAVETLPAEPDAVPARSVAPPPAPLDAVPPPTSTAAPIAPKANTDGCFSLARQLGLGVSRIVIDPATAAATPGPRARHHRGGPVAGHRAAAQEAARAQPGFHVVMTRHSDVFVPLRSARASPTGRRRPVPLDPRQRQPEHGPRTGSRPTS